MEARQELEMRGIGAAPGIVAGPVLLLKADDEPLPEYAVAAEDVPREMLRLEAALIETRRQLDDVRRRVGEALGLAHHVDRRLRRHLPLGGIGRQSVQLGLVRGPDVPLDVNTPMGAAASNRS